MSLPALTLKGLLTSDNFGDFVHVGSDICKGAEVAADDFLGGGETLKAASAQDPRPKTQEMCL